MLKVEIAEKRIVLHIRVKVVYRAYPAIDPLQELAKRDPIDKVGNKNGWESKVIKEEAIFPKVLLMTLFLETDQVFIDFLLVNHLFARTDKKAANT